MRCNYFDGNSCECGHCHFIPSEDEVKTTCETWDFVDCPRLKPFISPDFNLEL